MSNRRTFALSMITLAMSGRRAAFAGADPAATVALSARPAPGARRFTSPAIESAIATVRRQIGDPKLAALFENCFPNTLDTTVELGQLDGKPDAFIITGDIDALWLRDSSAQVWPYLAFATQDPNLRTLFRGLIHRQSRCILIDPYANAFTKDPAAATHLSWASLMHEAFDQDDPKRFTRPWFAWANSLFGELMLDLARRKPALLRRALS